MATRNELTDEVRKRYGLASRAEKGRILDEFVKTTGYHRKHALRLMNHVPSPKQRVQKERIYDVAVKEALILLWEAGDRMCGKRLKIALPCLLKSLEYHGHLRLDVGVSAKLLAISPATIDRVLEPVRRTTGKRRRRPKKPNSVQRRIPVRTHNGASALPPGFFEVDFVVHNGGVVPGSCVHTFTLTDVCSGWTECVPLVARQQMLVVESLKLVRPHLPVPLLGFDSDNDSAFVNEALIEYCEAEGIEQTRSRPYKKNDQAWVEQKNGAVVRHFTGYGRYEGLEATRTLSRLYQNVRLYVNFFQPSFKLKSKRRTGARVQKFYYVPATPCDRLINDPRVAEDTKQKLRDQRERLDPVILLQNIRNAQAALAGLPCPAPTDTVDEFLVQMKQLWRETDLTRKPKTKQKCERRWRTRQDPFTSTWPQIESWLEVRPDATAKELLARLQVDHPGMFATAQLRTLQRRVQSWRQNKARALVMASCAATTLHETRPLEPFAGPPDSTALIA